MNKDLTEALLRDFPKLYRQRSLPITQSLMCLGFECGDGWEPLIRRLSERLEAMNGAGARIEAVQVKEKFGGLRFYADGATPEACELIDAAEEESCRTCEVCGAPGEERPGGWIRTLCEGCAGESA